MECEENIEMEGRKGIPLLPMNFINVTSKLNPGGIRWSGGEHISLEQYKESCKTTLVISEERVAFDSLAEAIMYLQTIYHINVIFRP